MTSDIAEAIDLIQKTAIKSAEIKPFVIKDIRPGWNRVFKSQTDCEDIKQIPHRNSVVNSLHDVVSFVHYISTELAVSPVVYINQNGVQVIIDDSSESDRRDQCVMFFKLSKSFEVLNMLHDSETHMSQRELLAMLKRSLYLSFISSLDRDEILKALRAIRFDSDEQQRTGTVRRSISTIDDNQRIPEEIAFNVRVFTDETFPQVKWNCFLELDPDQKTFSLIPIEDPSQVIAESVKFAVEWMKREMSFQVFAGHQDQ